MRETPNYYSIIPAYVRYCEDLSAQEKLLYSEITALTNYKGYCWATNNYFADLYNLSKETISRQISKLAKYGFIRIEMIYFKDSKQIQERRIYLPESDGGRIKRNVNTPIDENVNTPIDENVNTPIDENVNTSIDENVNTPIDENVKDNNTSDNISISNQIISNHIKSDRFSGETKEKKTDTIDMTNTIPTQSVKLENTIPTQSVKLENTIPTQSAKLEKRQKKESFPGAYAYHSNKAQQENSKDKYNLSEIEEIIKSNIDYDCIIIDDPFCKEMLDGVVHVIASTIVTDFQDGYISMKGENVPADVVKSVFLKLTKDDIEYFIDNFNRQTSPTIKLTHYIRTSLYRNYGTIDFYWKNRVNVDMPCYTNRK